MLQLITVVVALLQVCVQAAPLTSESLGINLDKRSGRATITLPDATYEATKYDILNDIYTFSNIRFAAPPVGDLRWAKPAPPPKNPNLQKGTYGNSCVQAQIKGINFFGSFSDIPGKTALSQFINELAEPFETGGAEDCLFLDVYVPGKAVRSPSKSNLPVVHYFYGGGYVLGNKNQLQPFLPFYDGTGMVDQSNRNIIFVASNYRLGAFGFLAGTSMEEQGLPNAGLWDQHAALQWTKDNIGLFGGDGDQITAMGESAGASSLLHHLVFEGGTKDPLFKRVLFQSPAFAPMFDRKGSLEQTFKNFTKIAGCTDGTVACLRSLPTEKLIESNKVLLGQAPSGTFAVGPSADGSLIRQTPILELASGNYWKGLESLLVSHTSDESTLFVDGAIRTDEQYLTFIGGLFPDYAVSNGLDEALYAQYPSPSAENSPYNTQGDRVRAVLRDASFTCNARFIAQAWEGKTYSMQYSYGPGWHATDLIPAFWSNGLSSSPLGSALSLALPLLSAFSYAYKSYFTSFIRTGDPNKHRAKLSLPFTINWPKADPSGEEISNVLDAGDLGFHLVDDDQNRRSSCQFWQDLYAGQTIAGGYSPPGAIVDNPYIKDTSGASDNYD